MTHHLKRSLLVASIFVGMLQATPVLANCDNLTKQAKVLAEELHGVEHNLRENAKSVEALKASPASVVDIALTEEANTGTAELAVKLETRLAERNSLREKRKGVIEKISNLGEKLKKDCAT